MPSSTSSRMYSEIACGVTPSFAAISCCRTAGWCSAISTRIWSRVTSRLLRRMVYRGSLPPGIKPHQSLAFYIEVGDPFREPFDKNRTDTEFAGKVIDGCDTPAKVLLDLL